MNQVDREILVSYGIFNFTEDFKKMLSRPGQLFWRIFQVKYLRNDSSNQYGSRVVLD